MHLVVDACALLHAKQLDFGGRGLLLLERLCRDSGVRLHTTSGVQTEQVAMSLSGVLETWRQAGWWQVHRMPVVKVKATKNRVQGIRPLPGARDLGLVTLACDLGAVLLTHDDPAGAIARHLRLTVVDLLDLGDLLARKDPSIDLDGLFARWNASAWRPADWLGSATATLAARPGRQAVMGRMLV